MKPEQFATKDLDLERFEVSYFDVPVNTHFGPDHRYEFERFDLPPLEVEPGEFKIRFVEKVSVGESQSEVLVRHAVYETSDRKLGVEGAKHFQPPPGFSDQTVHTYARRFAVSRFDYIPKHPHRGFEPEQFRPHERKWLGAWVTFEHEGHDPDIAGWIMSLSPSYNSAWVRVDEESAYYDVSLNDPSLRRLSPGVKEMLAEQDKLL